MRVRSITASRLIATIASSSSSVVRRKLAPELDPGVVDQDVQRAERLLAHAARRWRSSASARSAGACRTSTPRPRSSAARPSTGGPRQVGQGEVDALRRERPGDVAAEAASGAGDEGVAAAKLVHGRADYPERFLGGAALAGAAGLPSASAASTGSSAATARRLAAILGRAVLLHRGARLDHQGDGADPVVVASCSSPDALGGAAHLRDPAGPACAAPCRSGR